MPRPDEEKTFVGATHCVALLSAPARAEKGEAVGAPKKRFAFLGTPTRPYERESGDP